ncbi:MAG TPA: ComEA family DNA-binding protein [Gemmatimonadaceae bacterium]
MPTPSEQKALAFVAIVVLLGGTVRVLRANSSPEPTVAEQQAVAAQAHAVEVASSSDKASRTGRRARSQRSRGRDTVPVVVGGVSSVAPSFARPDRPYAKSPYGYPPAGPRMDVNQGAITVTSNSYLLGSGRVPSPPVATRNAPRPPGERVDLDRATVEEIDRLPRIGPALAQRIVANRDSLGPFGSLANLRRVKGLGPAMLSALDPLVTFGAQP